MRCAEVGRASCYVDWLTFAGRGARLWECECEGAGLVWERLRWKSWRGKEGVWRSRTGLNSERGSRCYGTVSRVVVCCPIMEAGGGHSLLASADSIIHVMDNDVLRLVRILRGALGEICGMINSIVVCDGLGHIRF